MFTLCEVLMQVKRKQIALDVAQGGNSYKCGCLINHTWIRMYWEENKLIFLCKHLIIAVRELFYSIPIFVSFMSSADLKLYYLLLIFKVSFTDMHYMLYAFASATPAK